MRFIKTNNSIAEFIETDKTGKIISSRGFQFGVIYFEIKNKKVAFYLDNDEQPFQNFVWSTDIPLTIDDVEYETEEEVSAALHSIFNDRFQEQLDQLKEDLAAEEARAQEAEAQLDDKIDDESARAIAAENRLQDQVTELSGAVAVLDNRVTNVENDLSALTDTVNDEITRSTAKDAEHDAQISGLTNTLNSEIQRALAAESAITENLNSEISRSTEKDAQHDAQISALTVSLSNEINRATTAENGIIDDLNDEISRATTKENQLDAKIDLEIANRIADVNAEKNRALAAEQALDSKIDNEITRSTAKDASHDTLISGLTTNLQNEINRATSAENSLRNDLNAEIQNRIDAISGLTERVADDEASTGAALVDLNDKVNALSGENASQNVQISGLNNSINTEISRATSVENALRSDLTNETSARTNADAAMLERIVAVEVGKADKSDLNNYYTKAESDAKYATKDYVSGLTDNFYTKGQTNELLAAKADKADVNAISGDVIALSTKVDTISGEIITIQEEIDDIDLSDYYTKTESDGKYQLKGDYVTGAQMSAYTYDKQTIDDKIAQGGSFDPTQYYNKTATDALLANKADLSGLTSHTANTTVHVTSAEKNTWNNKSDFSGNYNDLTNKPTIHTYTAGTGIDITNDVISVTGGSQPVDAYTKAESDAKFATITNFNSHSGNTTMHVTSAEKATWNAKADASSVYNKTEIDNKLSAKPNVWCGNESEWSQISGSTESGTIYLVY